jgi:hypothetical protein
MADTPEPVPLLWHGGQSWSQQTATVELARLDADESFRNAALGGDTSKQRLRAAFREMSLGRQPGEALGGVGGAPIMPQTPDQVRGQMQERDLAIDDARLGTWERLVSMDDQMKLENRRGLATAEQVADAKLEVKRMIADRELGRKILNNDMDAKRKWLLAGRVAGMQVASPDHKWE